MTDTTEVTDPADAAPDVPASSYRPHIDGLRTIAVYVVVLFHAGLSGFSGGYIGVDVFFVLSGYLVTTLLLRDLAGGKVRFARFYARRFRRLLPAAFVTLMVTALVFAAVTPSGAEAAYGAFRAAFLYVANWYFIRQSTNYFGAAVATNPVLQFWSLAVEEQFYLLWPLVLTGIVLVARRFPRHRTMVVRAAIAIGGLASLAWAFHLRTGDVNRAYFGTDARAYQLMAGASIALLPDLGRVVGRFGRALQVVAVLATVALVGVATSAVDLDPISRGAVAVAITCVALIVYEHAQGGPVKWLLSTDLFVYLGRISYGTYLWHWPVVILAGLELHLSSGAMAWFACLVATGIASLSFQLVEHPIRVSHLLDRYRVPVIAAGLAVSALSAFVLIPRVITPGSTSSAAPVGAHTGFTPVPSWVDTAKIYFEGFGIPIRYLSGGDQAPGCVGEAPQHCTIVPGHRPSILLMGDSNAEMYIPAFEAIARQSGFSLSLAVTAGCPWQRGYYTLKNLTAICRQRREDAYRRVIPALNPDLVVLVDADPSSVQSHSGVDQNDRTMEQTTMDSLRELDNGHRDIVIVKPEPIPPRGMNPLNCLETARWLEDCRYLADLKPTFYDTVISRAAAQRSHVSVADLDRLICPYLPICDPIVNGIVVKWNGQHLTTRFSTAIGPGIAAYLRQKGLLPA